MNSSRVVVVVVEDPDPHSFDPASSGSGSAFEYIGKDSAVESAL